MMTWYYYIPMYDEPRYPGWSVPGGGSVPENPKTSLPPCLGEAMGRVTFIQL
jgi:hypothetical protein